MIETARNALTDAKDKDLLVLTDAKNGASVYNASRISEIAVKDGYAVIIERDKAGSDISRVNIQPDDLYAALDEQGFSTIDRSGFQSGLKGDFMKVGGGDYHYIVNVMGLTSPKASSPPSP